jgi:hypothetical protein
MIAGLGKARRDDEITPPAHWLSDVRGGPACIGVAKPPG